jgi:hypothetical protein
MVLVCDVCLGGGVTPELTIEAELPEAELPEDDLDEVYISIEADDDDIYDDVQISVDADPEPDPDPRRPPVSDGNIIYGTDDDAVSGAVDVDSGRVQRRDPGLPPVVIE